MKKSIVFLSCVALLMVGCAKVENEVDVLEKGTHQVTLKAYVDEADTRISADASGKFSWQAGDCIVVLTDDDGAQWVETEDSGETASFDVTLQEGVNLGQYAFYPAAEGCGVSSDNEINFGLEPTYDYVKDATNMPMLGTISSEGVSFKAVGGVLKLIVYNVPESAKSLTFSVEGKKITGDFTVVNDVIATEAVQGTEVVTFNFGEGRTDNMVFYIPLPTGNIGAFTLSFYEQGNNNPIYTKTANANLSVGRNKLIVAPALNCLPAEEVCLWTESFTTELDAEGTGTNAIVTVADYNGEKKGQTVYSGTVSYSINGNTNTVLYKEGTIAKGKNAGELMLAKKTSGESGKNGEFLVEGIPTAGASSAILSFVSNTNAEARALVSTSTNGVTIGARTVSGSATPYTISYAIAIDSGVSSFNLTFSNSNTSSNTRIDDIVLEATIGTAPTTPSIITQNGETATIGAGNQHASINGIKLVNPLDNLGITATTTADWLTVEFTEGNFETGAKLTATATSYNHNAEARSATVTLKATGATKTVTFTQNPSLVPNPTTLTATPGDQTFSVSWTGDSKASSYVAYYSNSDLSSGNPATNGTALTVTKEGNAYTAVPEETLVNRTTYYVYVKVGSVNENYPAYDISAGWASTTVVPVGEVAVQTVSVFPYEQNFKTNGQGLFVEDIVDDGGTGAHIWTNSSSYGMVASGRVSGTNYDTEAWLYSPKIPIPSTINNPYVSFKHIGNYFTNQTNMRQDLKIYVREVGADWTQMDVPYPAGNTFSGDWTVVDYALSSFKGKTVQFRWKYTSTESRCGTYQMDEFKVYDKPASDDKTVTYTVATTSSVTATGDAPTGSSASYSSTYSSKYQLTGGNSMTLTLSGFAGKTIKGLSLSMKSNGSSGSGYMYMATKNGTTLTNNIASIGSSDSGKKFNDSAWYGAWSTSYVDVTVPVTETTVEDGEDVVIFIAATANSLYCQSFTLTYE